MMSIKASRVLLSIQARCKPLLGNSRFKWIAGAALMASAWLPGQAQALTVTHSGGFYTVATGGALTYKVNDTDCNIQSIVYNGTELQLTSPYSHLISGLWGVTVTQSTLSSGTVSLIACTTTSVAVNPTGTLTHYLVSRNGEDNIYMATYTDGEPDVGELRWITRLNGAALPNRQGPSDLTGTTGAIESSDIFGMANGQTRSKYYGNQKAKDLTIRGITGSGVGVFMAYGNRESASGGPFFRDIQNQNAEVYNYMNSGHNQTEAWRVGVLHGPYALVYTNGSTPTAVPDMSWMSTLGLTGWVSSRGYVSGKAMGVTSGIASLVGWSNATAQYWATPNASTGNFYSPAMKPGTYTQSLYQGELAVATKTVTVTAGSTNSGQNITSAWSTPASPIFRIGNWDGAPTGFLNFDKLTLMHPSDVRMAAWGVTNYVVGSSADSTFPSYQWKGVNNSTTIHFTLTAAQIAARTVRIGITGAYAGGRPAIGVNSWSSSLPAATSQPSSRSFTIGTYRGNNYLFPYSVPSTAFVVGSNTMTISVNSGSSGSGYLSPAISYDAVEMY